MSRSVIAAVIFVALVGCAPYPVRDRIADLRASAIVEANHYGLTGGQYFAKHGAEKTIEAGLNALKLGLKDPDSATFQAVRLVDYFEGKVVCGRVNAKNSYGGYVGYKPFVAGPGGATIYDADMRYPAVSIASHAGISAACGD